MVQSDIQRPVVIVTILATFLGGGLAGAVFSWYMNRPEPTLVTYSITTTVVAEPAAASPVANMKIQVGGEEINALYTHTIEFTTPRGPYADGGEVAVTFLEQVRIFGMTSDAPSPVHYIICQQLDNGARCTISPLTPGSPGKFRVTLATDQKVAPNIVMAAKNVELLKVSDFLYRDSWSMGSLVSAKTLLLGAAVVLYFVVFPVLILRRLK